CARQYYGHWYFDVW
nr:immunoglobulin heavy chain junction region [Mus musculus]